MLLPFPVVAVELGAFVDLEVADRDRGIGIYTPLIQVPFSPATGTT